MKKVALSVLGVLILSAFLFADDCKIDSITVDNNHYYPLYKILNTLQLERHFDPFTQRIIIQDKGRYLTFFIDEDVVYYEQNNVYLDCSPIRYEGKIYIPESLVKMITDWKRGDYLFSFNANDFSIDKKQEVIYKEPVPEKSEKIEKTVESTINTDNKNNDNIITKETMGSLSKGSVHQIKVLVIDPGHGGLDPGAIGQKGLREKDVVLQTSLYVKSILEKKMPKLKVILCRTSDQYVSLLQRAKIANSYIDKNTSGLFISIHANASLNKKSKGMETFVLSPVASDVEARSVAAMENGIVGDNEKNAQEDQINKIISNLLSSEYIQESIQLANFLQGRYSEKLGGQDINRGIKKAKFSVLAHTFMPGILTEIGFITNLEEEKSMRKDWYLKNIADCIADSTIQYINWYEANNGFIQ